MKKKIVFISPGPVYRPESDSYKSHYLNLSDDFEGYIFTTSTNGKSFNIGSFNFNSMSSKFTFFSNFKFLLFCLLKALKLKLNKVKIDLVVTYDPIKTGFIGVLFSKIVNSKFAPEVNGVYTSTAEWLDLPDNTANRMKRFLIPHIVRFVLSRADGVKLLFDGQIEPFSSQVNGKIIKSYPCFVPTSQFKFLEEKKEVLFAGFPFMRKGVDILIQAFKEVAPEYPDWKLKILGWYPDLSKLEDAIDGHSQIYHHPPVHPHEMPDHIGSCAILVLPSRSEAMGRVLVEAMAAKKPRIGSNVDGIPTVINDGLDGFLVTPGDVNDLAEKLNTLMGSKELRDRMGQRGMERVKTEFTEKKYLDNVRCFYNEVIESL